MKKKVLAIVLSVAMGVFFLTACGSAGSGGSTGTETESDQQEDDAPSVESFDVSYDGSKKAGTVLDEENAGIHATITYDNGSTNDVTAWEIKEPKKLQAGKTTTVTVTYDGGDGNIYSADLSVKGSLTKKQYMEKCKEHSYENLARDPDRYEGKKIKIHGKVVQVIEDDEYPGVVELRVGTKNEGYGFYDDVVLVDYSYKDGDKHVLEDDMVTCWGVSEGTATYESTGAGSITIPYMTAKYLKIS